MTNNWRRAMAAAAARQGHVAQAEAQNNYGNNSNLSNNNDDNDKVWACWAQPFVVTADSPVLLTLRRLPPSSSSSQLLA